MTGFTGIDSLEAVEKIIELVANNAKDAPVTMQLLSIAIDRLMEES